MKTVKFIAAAMLLYYVFCLSVVVAVVWVAFHFIMKYW